MLAFSKIEDICDIELEINRIKKIYKSMLNLCGVTKLGRLSFQEGVDVSNITDVHVKVLDLSRIPYIK
jgi:hypothetical protein